MDKIIILFDSRIPLADPNNTVGMTTALNRREAHRNGNYFSKTNWKSDLSMWNTCVGSEQIEFSTLDEVLIQPDNKYFYVIPCSEYADIGSSIPLETLSLESQKKIAMSNISILYDYTFEICKIEDQTVNTLSLIYNGLCDINPGYAGEIVVSTANLQRAGWHKIRSISLPGWLPYTTEILLSNYPSVTVDSYLNGVKTSLFICLNNKPRQSRIVFLHGLRSRNLLQYGLVSNKFSSTPLSHYDIELLLTNTNHSDKLDYKILDSLITSGLDEMHLAESSDNFNNNYNSEWVQSVCFDVVTETTLGAIQQENMPTLSEKIVKAIFFGKPFMIVGDTGSLARLHDLGFKTFPFLFDESYDEKHNPLVRNQIILSNIERWVNNESKFMEEIRKHRDILDHNAALLRSFPTAAEYYRILKCNRN